MEGSLRSHLRSANESHEPLTYAMVHGLSTLSSRNNKDYLRCLLATSLWKVFCWYSEKEMECVTWNVMRTERHHSKQNLKKKRAKYQERFCLRYNVWWLSSNWSNQWQKNWLAIDASPPTLVIRMIEDQRYCSSVLQSILQPPNMMQTASWETCYWYLRHYADNH